jgi:hypothetical protein
VVTAVPVQRPTYVAADLTGLLVPQPAVHPDGDALTCGGWSARWAGDTVGLSGGGDPYDGLRALCAAAWSMDRPVPPQAVTGALDALGLG